MRDDGESDGFVVAIAGMSIIEECINELVLKKEGSGMSYGMLISWGMAGAVFDDITAGWSTFLIIPAGNEPKSTRFWRMPRRSNTPQHAARYLVGGCIKEV